MFTTHLLVVTVQLLVFITQLLSTVRSGLVQKHQIFSMLCFLFTPCPPISLWSGVMVGLHGASPEPVRDAALQAIAMALKSPVGTGVCVCMHVCVRARARMCACVHVWRYAST